MNRIVYSKKRIKRIGKNDCENETLDLKFLKDWVNKIYESDENSNKIARIVSFRDFIIARILILLRCKLRGRYFNDHENVINYAIYFAEIKILNIVCALSFTSHYYY